MRLTLVIPSIVPGGAENVIARLANAWADAGHDVSVITLSAVSPRDRPLRPSIRRVPLNMLAASRTPLQAFGNNWARLARLRAELRRLRPQAVISFLPTTNVLTLAAARGLEPGVIVAERMDPREEPIAPVWAAARRALYPQADAVVMQTPGASRWAMRFLPAGRVHVIPNPVPDDEAAEEAVPARSPLPDWLGRPGPKVFGMGRLTPQKGFDTLLRAFARCRRDHPDWSLIVLGEGEERTRLEALAAGLGLRSAVSFPGHVTDVRSVLRRGDLFVLSSRYEGFPNALLEAMTCGLPVISTDCPSGPRDIVRDGVDGVLVERDSVERLSEAMGRLMAAPGLRRQLAARAVEVRERFSLPRVMHEWNALLERCASGA